MVTSGGIRGLAAAGSGGINVMGFNEAGGRRGLFNARLVAARLSRITVRDHRWII